MVFFIKILVLLKFILKINLDCNRTNYFSFCISISFQFFVVKLDVYIQYHCANVVKYNSVIML